MKHSRKHGVGWTFGTLLLRTSLLALAGAAAADPPTVRVVIAPGYSNDTGKALLGSLQNLVLNKMEPGDRLVVVDGREASKIATLTRPDGSPAWIRKDRALMRGFSKLKKHFESGKASKNTSTVLLPEALTFVGEQELGSHKGPVCVLIQGDSLYKNPADAVASMLDPLQEISPVRVPLDGHLRGTRFDTPYGAADRAKMLADYSIHFAYADDWKFNEDYEWIKRFWTLMVQQMGGELITFTSDLDTAVNNFTACQTGVAPEVVFNQTKDKIQMRIHNETSVESSNYGSNKTAEMKVSQQPLAMKLESAEASKPVSETKFAQQTTSTALDVPLGSKNLAPESLGSTDFNKLVEDILRAQKGLETKDRPWGKVRTVETTAATPPKPNLRVILSWSGDQCQNVDLDLYANVRGSGNSVSYKSPASPLGTHTKVPSAGERNGIEMISLAPDLKPKDVQLSVNFYRGDCEGPVTVWLTVMRDGASQEVQSRTLEFNTERGNGGGIDSPAHWRSLSLADVLSQKPAPR